MARAAFDESPLDRAPRAVTAAEPLFQELDLEGGGAVWTSGHLLPALPCPRSQACVPTLQGLCFCLGVSVAAHGRPPWMTQYLVSISDSPFNSGWLLTQLSPAAGTWGGCGCPSVTASGPASKRVLNLEPCSGRPVPCGELIFFVLLEVPDYLLMLGIGKNEGGMVGSRAPQGHWEEGMVRSWGGAVSHQE